MNPFLYHIGCDFVAANIRCRVEVCKIVCNAFQTLRNGCSVVGKGYTVFSVSGGYCRTSQMSKVKYLFFQLKIS